MSSYGTDTMSSANTPFSTNSKLLSVPVIASSVLESEPTVNNQSSFLKYVVVFFILGFLGLTLYLYLEKPVDESIKNLYDPVLKYIGVIANDKDKQKAAVNKLEHVLKNKKVINKIDDEDTDEEEAADYNEDEEQARNLLKREFINPPVIPKPDDATSSLQMNKPKSKAGYCYIGEDRGFRSCIKVEEGDVCMSGDIFPTHAVCINPNLRE